MIAATPDHAPPDPQPPVGASTGRPLTSPLTPFAYEEGQGVRFPKGAPAMSAASARSAAAIPLREQAFTLHCQGLRSPAIAAELGVSARTIRAWIAAALADLKDEHQHTRREQLLLAVERQHQLTATA